MPPPAISTRGARDGSSLLGIGMVFAWVFFSSAGAEAAAGASATAFVETTRGRAAGSCGCCWDREEAATRVEEEASNDERGERKIGVAADDDGRHPAPALAARPAAATGSGMGTEREV